MPKKYLPKNKGVCGDIKKKRTIKMSARYSIMNNAIQLAEANVGMSPFPTFIAQL